MKPTSLIPFVLLQGLVAFGITSGSRFVEVSAYISLAYIAVDQICQAIRSLSK